MLARDPHCREVGGDLGWKMTTRCLLKTDLGILRVRAWCVVEAEAPEGGFLIKATLGLWAGL